MSTASPSCACSFFYNLQVWADGTERSLGGIAGTREAVKLACSLFLFDLRKQAATSLLLLTLSPMVVP